MLGDLSVSADMLVYDDGRHRDPAPHPAPFPATLVFTPGALLRNGCSQTPADWTEVTDGTGALNQAGYAAGAPGG